MSAHLESVIHALNLAIQYNPWNILEPLTSREEVTQWDVACHHWTYRHGCGETINSSSVGRQFFVDELFTVDDPIDYNHYQPTYFEMILINMWKLGVPVGPVGEKKQHVAAWGTQT